MNQTVEPFLKQAASAAGQSKPHESAHLHVTGSAPYTDDILELQGTLHCALGLSPVAHGQLLGIDLDAVKAMPGVVAVITAADIPGRNDCGAITHDDPILADGELMYLGSANWTGAGLGAKGAARRNFELGIVTDDGPLLDQVQAIYERIWTGGECEGCRLREECPGPLVELAAKKPVKTRRSRRV